MTRLLCQPCAAVSERWVTLYPIDAGACRGCGRMTALYGVRQQQPEAGFTIRDGQRSTVVADVPWRCPCCEGKGQVEDRMRRHTQGFRLGHQTPCLACGGGGLVWAERDAARGDGR